MIRSIGLFFCLFFVLNIYGQETSPYIVVDQFGYLPEMSKVAVIRNPKIGYDEEESFTPGSSYQLVEASTGEVVFSGEVTEWNSGNTDNSSGDQAWWFDFSTVNTIGSYYVLDVENEVRSYTFTISPSAYNEVLKHTMRTFYYQRVGFAKETPYAEEGWTDEASHLGPLQDKNCRPYNDPDNESLEVDVSGGWYDAGDYNKYTNWNANYVVDMVKAYLERPEAWGDDYNIPESGNGVPDLLDEVKWGLEHLLRMQQEDGSMLSIVSEAHATPPSSASGPSVYGLASTSASLNCAGAFAISAKVFEQLGQSEFAMALQESAIEAWNWANENPNVTFYNNSAEHGTQGVGAGQQETDDYGRAMAKLEAACFLFELTGDELYQNYFDNNYTSSRLFVWAETLPFESQTQEVLLYYAQLENATPEVASDIISAYADGLNSRSDNVQAAENNVDPYLAHIANYNWGSNRLKTDKGSMFYNTITYSVPSFDETVNKNRALHYLHYLHGVNPLNIVYLSNMFKYGGENTVTEFYHTWFSHGSSLWDKVGFSTYGPAPGYLVGGPNPRYTVDDCCPDNCGTGNNEKCTSIDLSPPQDQPDQKSYKEFNHSWPINSWEVTENHLLNQVSYVRLLSKFVNLDYDCAGVENGSATVDVCGTCSGGTTGLEAVSDPSLCSDVLGLKKKDLEIALYPNPTRGIISIQLATSVIDSIHLLNLNGEIVAEWKTPTSSQLNISHMASGMYFILIHSDQGIQRERIVKY